MDADQKLRRAAELAHILFEHEGWYWRPPDAPSVEAIEDKYRDLIKLYREHGSEGTISSGRLIVEETDGGVHLGVEVGCIFPFDDHAALI